MPIRVEWDSDEKRVVHYTFDTKWSWDEYHAAIAQAYDMVKDLPYIVNMILDFSSGNMFPSNALSHFGNSMKTPPREFDVAVVVTKSRFVDNLVTILGRIAGKAREKLIVRKSVEEARVYLSTLEKRMIEPVNVESS
jgi:hypothetical protein